MTRLELKKFRAGLKLTQKGFADRFHLRLRTIQDWEQGHREIGKFAERYLNQVRKDQRKKV